VWHVFRIAKIVFEYSEPLTDDSYPPIHSKKT